jgi:hypothetical protein
MKAALAAGAVAIAALLTPWRASEPPRRARPAPDVAEEGVASRVPDADSSNVPGPPSTGAPAIEPPEPAVITADGAALREDADRLIAEGKVLEGLEVFREAVEAAPTAENHGDLGNLLYRLTAYDEAAIHLRAAAELDPSNADRWIALANVYYRKIDPGEAWKAEKRAREAEPGLELGRDGSGMRVRKGDKAPRQP